MLILVTVIGVRVKPYEEIILLHTKIGRKWTHLQTNPCVTNVFN